MFKLFPARAVTTLLNFTVISSYCTQINSSKGEGKVCKCAKNYMCVLVEVLFDRHLAHSHEQIRAAMKHQKCDLKVAYKEPIMQQYAAFSCGYCSATFLGSKSIFVFIPPHFIALSIVLIWLSCFQTHKVLIEVVIHDKSV